MECKYCEEINNNWTDSFEGVIHHLEFKPDYERDSKYYHGGTHIYETNNYEIK